MKELRRTIQDQKEAIHQWLTAEEQKVPLPPYISVDIRDAGYKAAVVDTNIFPAGWNNLSEQSRSIATEGFRDYITENYPTVRTIGIVPENHTRNAYYFDNIAVLEEIVRDAGFTVWVTHVNPELKESTSTFRGSHENELVLHQLQRDGDRIFVNAGEPNLLLLNNDLANGLPDILQDLKIPVIPFPRLGWFERRKSCHFEIANRIIGEFAGFFGLDPWLMSTVIASARDVNFREHQGFDRIAAQVEQIMEHTSKKINEYHLSSNAPSGCVFIKDNSGTYGQAIIHVSSKEEVLEMNRKTINQMDVGKGSVKVDEVLIQECVPTRFVTSEWVGEPVQYVMGDRVVGGFARINPNQTPHGNLNSRGAYFADLNKLQDPALEVYEVLTRIARIAVGYEMKECTSS